MPPLTRRLLVLLPALVLTIAGATLAGAGSAQVPGTATNTSTTTARPIADAHVRADRARRSFGRSRTRWLDAAPRAHAYLAFPRAAGSGTVVRALLRVRVLKGSPAGFHVRTARSTWRERSLTYANAPRPSPSAVATGPVARGWASVDITGLVRRHGTGATFVLTTASRAGLVIASRESRFKPAILVTKPRPPQPPPPPPPPPSPPPPPPAPPPPPPPPAPGSGIVLAGAGDIAYGGSEDEATAKVLDAINPDIVFTLGDNAYDSGTAGEFSQWYHPTWGRHRAKTRPSAGNHDYRTSNASGYFAYFGAAAGDPAKGYYSYEAGAWHVVVLNTSGEGACAKIACNAGSAQEQWLRAELAASTAPCTLAYFHHPRYSIGQHGNHSGVQALWQALYDDGVEIVLAGHDHNYQRWKPLNAAGAVDTARGIRNFVVGTGDKNAYSLGSSANVEAAQTGTPGVLKLTLLPGSYQWQFVPMAGKTYTDSGSGTCH